MPTATTTALELGTPVRSLNWVRLFPGQTADGSPSLLASMGQDAGGLFVCDIDLATGHCRQFPVNLPHARFPTAACRCPRTGILYVGSAYTGHLHRLDPANPDRGLEDLGPIDPDLASFPCQIDIAPDGSIYIGAYPGCSLTRFNPADGSFHRLGRMDPTDMYFYPQVGADGTIAGLVRMCCPHVVVIDPSTSEHRTVGPVLDAEKDGPRVSKLSIRKGCDGLLYMSTSEGWFRLQGLEAIAIDHEPQAASPAKLPDGSTAEFTDASSFNFRTLMITEPDGSTRTLELDWQGQGTDLFMLHHGPDDRIYGSSILPEHLFVCDRDGQNMRDLGQCSLSGGEAYSMANLDGKIYIASYPAARLSIYDPARPYRFGQDEQANPRDIGRLDSVSYRPRAMLAGPAGKVWVGSVPDYGLWGGTLVNYDPATSQIVSHRHIVQDCSVVSLTWMPQLDQILAGASIHGGTGTQPRATSAAFFLWDPHRDALVSIETFGLADIDGIPDVISLPNHRALAVVVCKAAKTSPDQPAVSASLVLLDVAERTVLDQQAFTSADGWPLEVSFQRHADGSIVGCTRLQLYRVLPDSARRQTLWTTPAEHGEDYIRAPGPLVGNRFYFTSGHRLRCIDLPS